MQNGGAGNRTADLLIGGQPALPPEPQLLSTRIFHTAFELQQVQMYLKSLYFLKNNNKKQNPTSIFCLHCLQSPLPEPE